MEFPVAILQTKGEYHAVLLLCPYSRIVAAVVIVVAPFKHIEIPVWNEYMIIAFGKDKPNPLVDTVKGYCNASRMLSCLL
jgi:hypothetical protein